MKYIILPLFVISTITYSNEIKILSWYKTNRTNDSDSTAEVCFSVKNKTIKPLFAQITVDKGYKSEALYSAWVGPQGSVCELVSTLRGTVEVFIPDYNLNIGKTF